MTRKGSIPTCDGDAARGEHLERGLKVVDAIRDAGMQLRLVTGGT